MPQLQPPSAMCIVNAQLEWDEATPHWIGEVEHVQSGWRQRFTNIDEMIKVLKQILNDEVEQAKPQE
jgi:hypothetical protein